MDTGPSTGVRGRALADPTRRRLLGVVAHADGPVPVAVLAAECGVHPNTVRLHLAQLVAAGLVVQERGPAHGRGRPAYRYRAVGMDPSDEAAAYRRLAVLLAHAVRRGGQPAAVGYRAGLAAGRDLDHDGPRSALVDTLEADGFLPVLEAGDGDVDVLRLRRCPFASVVSEEPTVVCQLHLGLVRGLAEGAGNLTIAGVDIDPYGEGCRLLLSAAPREDEDRGGRAQ